MGLFDQVLGALNNPSQQASTDQLGSILGVVQQLSGSQGGADATATQAVISVVGSYVRSSLQQRRSVNGQADAEQVVNQFSGTNPNPDAVNALFSASQQNEIAQAASQRTGLNAETIQSMLPLVIPIVLNLLQSGNQNSAPTQPSPSPSPSTSASNSVLNAFLDADNDGQVDVADAISMASRFMSR